MLAPVVDERLLEVRIEVAGVHVRLALIPDRPTDGVGNDGRDHAVVQDGGVVLVLDWIGIFRPLAAVPFGEGGAVVEEQLRIIAEGEALFTERLQRVP